MPFRMVAQEEQGVERGAVVRQEPRHSSFLCPKGRPTGHTLPIEQLIVFTLADEIVIVKSGRKRRYGLLPDARISHPLPHCTHHGNHRTTARYRQKRFSTPHHGGYEIAQCVWASACRPPHRKCKALAMLPRRPVGRKVTEIFIFLHTKAVLYDNGFFVPSSLGITPANRWKLARLAILILLPMSTLGRNCWNGRRGLTFRRSVRPPAFPSGLFRPFVQKRKHRLHRLYAWTLKHGTLYNLSTTPENSQIVNANRPTLIETDRRYV